MDWPLLFNADLIYATTIKLMIAAFLGGLVGLERECHGEAAGFRTYILVAIGSCLMMMISLNMENIYSALNSQTIVRLDPGRIASYALAGMGFLGAGAIISEKGSVKGITTAAGMWMITGVGLAVGSGYFVPAILATLFSVFTLYVLRYAKSFFHKDIDVVLVVVTEDTGGQRKQIEEVIAQYPRTSIQSRSFSQKKETGMISFRFNLITKEDIEWPKATEKIKNLPGVKEISLEEK